MHLSRRGVSTIFLAVVVVAVVAVAAVAYILSSTANNGGTSSTSPTQSTVLCCTSTTVSSSFRVSMELQPSTPLVSSDVTANYTLQVTVLGTLDSPLMISASVPQGLSVVFTPSQIQPGTESSSVMVSIKPDASLTPGSVPFNITASSSGEENSQKFSMQVVKYLVVTVGESFVPNSVSVPAGSTVYWVRLNGALSQYDNGDHNVVFNSLQASSPTLGQYQSWSYAFNQAGTFTYSCTFHTGMTGQITVT